LWQSDFRVKLRVKSRKNSRENRFMLLVGCEMEEKLSLPLTNTAVFFKSKAAQQWVVMRSYVAASGTYFKFSF